MSFAIESSLVLDTGLTFANLFTIDDADTRQFGNLFAEAITSALVQATPQQLAQSDLASASTSTNPQFSSIVIVDNTEAIQWQSTQLEVQAQKFIPATAELPAQLTLTTATTNSTNLPVGHIIRFGTTEPVYGVVVAADANQIQINFITPNLQNAPALPGLAVSTQTQQELLAISIADNMLIIKQPLYFIANPAAKPGVDVSAVYGDLLDSLANDIEQTLASIQTDVAAILDNTDGQIARFPNDKASGPPILKTKDEIKEEFARNSELIRLQIETARQEKPETFAEALKSLEDLKVNSEKYIARYQKLTGEQLIAFEPNPGGVRGALDKMNQTVNEGTRNAIEKIDEVRDTLKKADELFKQFPVTWKQVKQLCEKPIVTEASWTAADQQLVRLTAKVATDNTGGELRKLGIPYVPIDGFAAALYKENNQYYLVFRGSADPAKIENWINNEMGQDWLNANRAQALTGASSQYNQAVILARYVKNRLGTENVTLLGHSLGGGLASAAAYATGMDAVIFNAAGLHQNYRQQQPGKITHNIIHCDVLDIIQRELVTLPNLIKEKNPPASVGERRVYNPLDLRSSPIERHQLNDFLNRSPSR